MTRAVGAAVLWVRDCARMCSGFLGARGEVASRRPSVAALGTRRDPPPGRREYDIGKFVERRAYNMCIAAVTCFAVSAVSKPPGLIEYINRAVRSVTRGGPRERRGRRAPRPRTRATLREHRIRRTPEQRVSGTY